jgi:hypothetical protein
MTTFTCHPTEYATGRCTGCNKSSKVLPSKKLVKVYEGTVSDETYIGWFCSAECCQRIADTLNASEAELARELAEMAS